jgi:hypothetical protein
MSAITITYIVALVSFIIVVALALLTMGQEKRAKPLAFFINMSVAMFFVLFYVYITEFYFDLGALVLLCLGVILGLLGGLATKIYAKNGEVYSKKTRVFLLFWAVTIVISYLYLILGSTRPVILTVFSTGALMGANGNYLYRTAKVAQELEEEVRNE